ncbi:UV damage repair endonuclease UvdE [Bacillus coahuilensis m2-6]|uniref:UV DNA damage repair endonuclease UvsE n=1 Tax=Bacillus coahuilensis TaxID=408580 RepID=UPI00018514AB|nr:UV DNA damage repair endonuclease UvsE [Bacillus coahuilensis]KUP04956.1 UV damage repair endonuclease UvdE [Bacillus coahuilensis m2-6]
MRIRFGFVSNANALWDASPAQTVTYKRFTELGQEKGTEKLLEVTAKNLRNTKRILYYLGAHDAHVYRMSSSLVPLATHPDVMWDFVTPFKQEWEELGRLVKELRIRASFHPNQFTLFTSPREEVTANAIKDMDYHYKMLEAMRIVDQGVINIHIGGTYGDREAAIGRFHENLKGLPFPIKEIMTLENDDKTYTVEETLEVCEKESIPMVLDIHHHIANPTEAPVESFLPRIFETWKHRDLPPKIHISSPKNKEEGNIRAHADYVDLDFILPLLKELKKVQQDVDFMIEAKEKDFAMLQLVEDVAGIRGVKRIDGAEIEWK